MALRILTNPDANAVQSALSRVDARRSANIERLSSGLRINSARDDAAGLTISTRFTAQIRGLNQSVRNANDGVSLSQVAEGALQETTSLIRRVRELAVQAANDTLGDEDRATLQSEAASLVDEVQRIGDATEFNDRALLDGSFVGVRLHIGPASSSSLSLRIGDARGTALGRQAREQSAPLSTAALAFGDIELGGVAIRATDDSDDALSTANNDGSAVAKANAINSVTAFTGVRALVNETQVVGDAIAAGGTLDAGNSVIINGETILGFEVQPGDANQAFADAVNAVADDTGVVASVDVDGLINLTAVDGRNISVTTDSVQAATATGLNGLAAATVVTAGTLTLQSEDAFVLTLTAAGADAAIGFGAGVGDVTFGASGNALDTIDLSTREGAERAIDIADVALDQVLRSRAGLGAVQGRLESAVNSLGEQSQRLSAARARIRDLDFASETADFARNDILRTAGVSLLAQANVQPRVALDLLGGG